MHIYLAGPDVFLPEPLKVAKAKQEICQKHGFIGLFPWDESLNLSHLKPFEMGIEIYKSNIKLMEHCDLIVANMTPFRGPSMDVGTAFEMGYMAAQKKPVFGYTNDGRLYTERVVASSAELDEYGMTIERFEMIDNLMLEAAIVSSNGALIRQATDSDQYFTGLEAFEAVVKIAAKQLL